MVDRYDYEQLSDIWSCYDMQMKEMKRAIKERNPMLAHIHRRMAMTLMDTYFELVERMLVAE